MDLSLSLAAVRSQFRLNVFEQSDSHSRKQRHEVKGILYYDLSSIYHHLQIGTPLELKWEIGPEDTPVAGVHYRSFKLGYLPLQLLGVHKNTFQQKGKIQARVGALVKKKYMPVEALLVDVFAKKHQLNSDRK